MTNTDILLEDLEDVLDDATSIPLSKKYAVDVDKIKTIIEDIRLNTPRETKQAKAIVDSRNNILEEAKKEAADIIAKAQEEARELVARDQITQTAQAEAADIIAKAKEQGDSYIADAQNQASDILGNASNQANEMVTTAQNKSREMLTAVNNYADDTLLSIDDSLYKALADVRRIRKGIEDAKKNIIEVPLKGTTIPHEVIGCYGAARVLLKPAAPGTGVLAGGTVRAVVEMAGIKDIRAKCLRSSNPTNVVKATFEGLRALRTREQVAAGLNKIGDVTVQNNDASVLGKARVLAHLIKVENV